MITALTKLTTRTLDRIALSLGRAPAVPAHLATGRKGEELAYFFLRKQGYTMVARNFRTPRRRGEIDLIGWEKDVLCFVEVKTRSSREVKPAEAAVDPAKRDELRAMANDYMRLLKQRPQFRFDIVSVYVEGGEPELTLFRGAF